MPEEKKSLLQRALSVFHETKRGKLWQMNRLGLTRVFHLANAEHVHAVLNDPDSFPKPQVIMKQLSRIAGDSIFTDDGQRWTDMHKLLIGVFTPQMVSGHFAPLVASECNDMIDRWLASGKTIDAEKEMREMGARVIGRSIFGTGFSAEQARDIVDAVTELMSFQQSSLRTKIEAVLWFLRLPVHRLPPPANLRRAAEKINSIVEPVIAERKNKGIMADDILGRLLSAKDPETGRTLTDGEIRDQIVMFVIAGHETTSVGLTYALAEIIKHPDVLAGLRAEIDAVTGGKPVSGEDFKRLPSVTNAFREALRLHPPAFVIARQAAADKTFQNGEIAIKKGDYVMLDIHNMQRVKTYWEMGEEFIPARFENDPRPAAFMPFGYGPRVCIGQHMAMAEGTIALASIFNRLSLDIVREPDGAQYAFTMRPRGKLELAIRSRSGETSSTMESGGRKPDENAAKASRCPFHFGKP